MTVSIPVRGGVALGEGKLAITAPGFQGAEVSLGYSSDFPSGDNEYSECPFLWSFQHLTEAPYSIALHLYPSKGPTFGNLGD